MYNSISMQNTCDGPYNYLGPYVNKIFSTQTEVWSGARPSTAPITAPGGRDLGDFQASGQAGDIKFLPSEDNYLD